MISEFNEAAPCFSTSVDGSLSKSMQSHLHKTKGRLFVNSTSIEPESTKMYHSRLVPKVMAGVNPSLLRRIRQKKERKTDRGVKRFELAPVKKPSIENYMVVVEDG